MEEYDKTKEEKLSKMNNNLLDKEFKVIIIKGYSMNSEWNEYSEKFNRKFGNIRASLVARMVKNLPTMQET